MDPNVFRDLSTGISNVWSSAFSTTLKDIRSNVALWFVILRDVSMVINLIVLVYIAINMAIATVASDKAKYKELLYNWVVSMVILFLLPQIMSALNIFSEAIVSIERNLMIALEKSNNSSFEQEILNAMFGFITNNGGLKMALYSIVYWMLIWTEVKFFTMYIKRMLTMMFLIVISPVITVTYAVDKIADRKAQAFNNWLHEYTTNLLIQPLHCFVYLIFMYMANNIAIEAPLVGVIFLSALTKGEKIIKKLIAISGVSIKEVGNEFSLKGMTGSLKKLVPKPGLK